MATVLEREKAEIDSYNTDLRLNMVLDQRDFRDPVQPKLSWGCVIFMLFTLERNKVRLVLFYLLNRYDSSAH